MDLFVDMDGVLVNFADSAIRALGGDPAAVWAKCGPGPDAWDFMRAMDMSASDFYHQLEAKGAAFWENLPEYPKALDFFAWCQSLATTYILTAPTLDPECATGKMRWLQARFGKSFSHFIVTRHKHKLAHGGDLLIDDNQENCAKFALAGGRSVLVPRYWNSLHARERDDFEHVKKSVLTVLKGDDA